MHFRNVAVVLWLACFGFTSRVATAKPTYTAYIAGYFSNPNYLVASVPWSQIDQVNIAFVSISNSWQCAWQASDGSDNSAVMNAFVGTLKAARSANNANNVKLVMSVGGAADSYNFSAAASSHAYTLASSCVNFMNYLGLDGIDYDWEYPGLFNGGNCPYSSCQLPADPTNFTNLLSQTASLMGSGKVLSAAVFPNVSSPPYVNYDYSGFASYLTQVNIMAYEFDGWSGDTTLGLNAPIDKSEASALFCMTQMGGSNAYKCHLGVPYYSHVYKNVYSNLQPGASCSGCQAVGSYDTAYVDMLTTYAADPHCTYTTNPNGAWYWCNSSSTSHANRWATFDPPWTMHAKAAWSASHGIGGMFYWVLPGDTSANDLTKAVHAGLEDVDSLSGDAPPVTPEQTCLRVRGLANPNFRCF